MMLGKDWRTGAISLESLSVFNSLGKMDTQQSPYKKMKI
jgi:hypothetical protein